MKSQAPLTRQVHEHLRNLLSPGCNVIDATAGNGHDTLALAELVGPSGKVWAFDRQPRAITACSNRLYQQQIRNVALVCADHADLLSILPTPLHRQIQAVVFNLGYLPGSDRSIITTPATTLAALRSALSILQLGGQLIVTAYTGHSGGPEEAGAVWGFFHQYATSAEVSLLRIDPLIPPQPAIAILHYHGIQCEAERIP